MTQKTITLILFIILFSVFSVLGIIMYLGLEQSKESKEWEVHSIQVKEKINELLHHIYNQESLNRGFALTLDSVFIADNRNEEKSITETIVLLDSLVRDNVSQVKRIKVLDSLCGKKMAYDDSLRIKAISNASILEKREFVLINLNLSEEIEKNCNLMLTEETQLLNMRKVEFEDEVASNKKSLLFLISGLLLVLLAVAIFLARIFNKINQAKKEMEARNNSLEEMKTSLLDSNKRLGQLTARFDTSLSKSKVGAFDWPNTAEQDFWLSDSLFNILEISKDDFHPNVYEFFNNLMHPEDSESVQLQLENHLKNGSTYSPEYRLRKSDGTYKNFRALGSSSIKDGVQNMTGVIIDIEEEIEVRKIKEIAELKMKEYSMRFNLVLKSSRYGVWDWYDINNPTQWWSDSFYNLIEYGSDEIESNSDNFHKLLHTDDQNFTQKSIEENIENGTIVNIEYRLKTKNHGYKWFRAVGDRIIDENEPGRIRMIGVVSDISKEKLFAEELKRSNADLQDFAYVASHDLQEPLRKIQAFGDRLNMLVKKDYPDFEGTMFIDKMNDSAVRMRKLIEDLLDFSRISMENILREQVDLNEIVNEVLSLLSEVVETSKVTIIKDELPILRQANGSNMLQLFQNIISNAIKFSNQTDEPKIEIRYRIIGVNESVKFSPLLNTHSEYHIIEVIDNGIGFEETYLNKIFTIFQRLHGRTEYQGTGIGLAVCKKICENHEGFITAKSSVGKGATFIVILPKQEHQI